MKEIQYRDDNFFIKTIGNDESLHNNMVKLCKWHSESKIEILPRSPFDDIALKNLWNMSFNTKSFIHTGENVIKGCFFINKNETMCSVVTEYTLAKEIYTHLLSINPLLNMKYGEIRINQHFYQLHLKNNPDFIHKLWPSFCLIETKEDIDYYIICGKSHIFIHKGIYELVMNATKNTFTVNLIEEL